MFERCWQNTQFWTRQLPSCLLRRKIVTFTETNATTMQSTVASACNLEFVQENFEVVKWWGELGLRKFAFFCAVVLTRRDATERETKIASKSTDRGLQSMRGLDFWDVPPPSWNVPKTIIHWVKEGSQGSVGLTVDRKLGPEDGTLGQMVFLTGWKIQRSVDFYRGGIFYPEDVAFECNVTICDGDLVPGVPV